MRDNAATESAYNCLKLIAVCSGPVEVGGVSERRLDLHGQLLNDIRAVALSVKHVNNSVQNIVAREDRSHGPVGQEFGSALLTASHRSCTVSLYRCKVLALHLEIGRQLDPSVLDALTGIIRGHIQHSGKQHDALNLHIEDQQLFESAVGRLVHNNAVLQTPHRVLQHLPLHVRGSSGEGSVVVLRTSTARSGHAVPHSTSKECIRLTHGDFL